MHEGILILGCPRSGTTLLRRLLNAHPDIACPAETYLFGACARFLFRERFAGGPDIGVLGGLSFAGFDDEEVLARLREFAFGFLREHARAAGKSRWAEKTAFDAFFLDRLEPLIGEHASFVCVERHGLDVVCSLAEATARSGGYAEPIHRYVRRYPQPLAAFAHLWVDLTRSLAAFAERHADRAVRVRYEDLCADPERELERVFVGIDATWNPTLIARALAPAEAPGIDDWKGHRRARIDSESVGRWRSLSPEAIALLAPIVNPTLAERGYERVAAQPPPSDAEARRRYALGLRLQSLKRPAGEGAEQAT